MLKSVLQPTLSNIFNNNQDIATTRSFLLLENNSYLLLQNGFKIIISEA